MYPWPPMKYMVKEEDRHQLGRRDGMKQHRRSQQSQLNPGFLHYAISISSWGTIHAHILLVKDCIFCLALFPGLPPFFVLWFTFSIIHRSASVYQDKSASQAFTFYCLQYDKQATCRDLGKRLCLGESQNHTLLIAAPGSTWWGWGTPAP